MRRPVGVVILAVSTAIGGILALFYGAIMFLLSSATADVPIPGFSMLTGYMAAIAFVIGCVALVLAVGLLALKRWAWLLAIALGVAMLVLSVLALKDDTLNVSLVRILVTGLILLYLWQPRVRRAFGRSV
jgi:hypothetical protein